MDDGWKIEIFKLEGWEVNSSKVGWDIIILLLLKVKINKPKDDSFPPKV